MPRKAIILFSALMLIAIAGCATRNSLAKIDTERQAKIEDALRDLKNKNNWERGNAINALVKLGAKEYAKDIAGLLKDKSIVGSVSIENESWGSRMDRGIGGGTYWYDETASLRALNALVQLQAKECAKDIAELLKDEDSDTIGVTVLALGRLDAKEYADNIKLLINDNNMFVSNASEKVLKKWGYDVEKLKAENKK